jgi:hypothetical protein
MLPYTIFLMICEFSLTFSPSCLDISHVCEITEPGFHSHQCHRDHLSGKRDNTTYIYVVRSESVGNYLVDTGQFIASTPPSVLYVNLFLNTNRNQ